MTTTKGLVVNFTTKRSPLEEIEHLADELTALELGIARARVRLNAAIKEGVKKGLPKAEVARAAGVSRQRIQALVPSKPKRKKVTA